MGDWNLPEEAGQISHIQELLNMSKVQNIGVVAYNQHHATRPAEFFPLLHQIGL